MKESEYNIYVPINKGVLCYNAFENNFALLSNNVYQQINKNEYLKIKDDIYKNLTENGFLIDDKKDEFFELSQEYDKSMTNNIFQLTLMPTLDCNVRCWYCFESQIKGSRLSVDMQEAIYKYAISIIENPKIEYLIIQLFGGEPLLYFTEELYPLLLRIKKYALHINKYIKFSFITNALCITNEMLPNFRELNATFQITIDGDKDKHNTVKKMKDSSIGSYEKVMDTIHNLTQYYDTVINLRINYDNKTLDHIEDVIKDIIDIDRKKIIIHLERVWQTRGTSNKQGKPIKDVVNLFILNGFRISYLNLYRRSYSCNVSKVNQLSISYNGDVYKCTGRNFTDKMLVGKLNHDGIIDWKDDKVNNYISIKTYENEMCKTCKLLPLCWGPCCQKQLEKTSNSLQNYCQLKDLEMSLDDYIIYKFNTEMINQKYKNE